MPKRANSPDLKNLFWFGTLLTLAMFTILLFWQLVGTTVAKGEELVAVLPRGPVIKDFCAYYVASLMFNVHEHHVYELAVQRAWENKLVAPLMTLDQPFGFLYPPYVFPLLMPVAWVSPKVSFVLWCFLGVLSAVLGGVALMRCLKTWTVRQMCLLELLSGLSFPGLVTLALGQVSWWLLGFCSLYTWCLINAKHLLGGVVLAVIAIKPHYAIFLGMPAIAMRRWKLILSAIISVALLVIWDGFTIGWDSVFAYPRVLSLYESSAENSTVSPSVMVSFRALYSILLPAGVALQLSLYTTIIGFCLTVIIWISVTRTETKFGTIHQWALALTVIISLVTSPHCHIHDQLFLALPAMLTLRQPEGFGTRNNWYRGWCILLVTYPLASLFFCMPSIMQAVRRLPNLAIMLGLLICGGVYFIELVKNARKAKTDDISQRSTS